MHILICSQIRAFSIFWKDVYLFVSVEIYNRRFEKSFALIWRAHEPEFWYGLTRLAVLNRKSKGREAGGFKIFSDLWVWPGIFIPFHTVCVLLNKNGVFFYLHSRVPIFLIHALHVEDWINTHLSCMYKY